MDRAALGTDTLLRLILLLVLIWLALELFQEVLGTLLAPLGGLRPIVGLLVLVLLVWYLLDRA